MPHEDRSQYVTVVTGLPRSGTSMMMAMLEAGGIPPLTDAARAPDEDNLRGYYEYEPVKRLASDASWMGEGRGRAVKVILPLLPHLPATCACRVVFMRRALDEVLASQRVMLERAGKRGGRIAGEQLRRLFESESRKAEAWLDSRPNIRWAGVSYNEVLAAPGVVVRVLGAFFGGLDESAMAGVIEPSLYRQREPAATADLGAGEPA